MLRSLLSDGDELLPLTQTTAHARNHNTNNKKKKKKKKRRHEEIGSWTQAHPWTCWGVNLRVGSRGNKQKIFFFTSYISVLFYLFIYFL